MGDTPETENGDMDPRLAEYLRDHCGPHHYGEQNADGIDLSLIRENLKRTPEQRLRRGEMGRRSLLWIRQNARRIDGQSTQNNR